MNLLSPTILAIAFACLSIVLAVSGLRRRSRVRGIFACLTTLIACALITTLGISATHGAFQTDAPWTMDTPSFMRSIRLSPIDENRGAEEGHLVILFRFGCADCEAVYRQVQETFGENVAWTSSRSDEGKRLVDEYSIGSVPTAIYFKRNVTGNQPDAIVAPLMKTDAAGENPTFDEADTRRILEAWNEKI